MVRQPQKILVINLKYIGDTIWMRPFLENLRLNLPQAEITAMVNKGGEVFLHLMPGVSEVIAVDRREIKGRFGRVKFIRFLKEIRKKGFDTVFLLSNSDRPTIIGYASGAKKRIGFKSDSWWRGLLLTDELRWDEARNPHMIEYHLQMLTDTGFRIYDRTLNLDPPEDEIRRIAERFTVLRHGEKKSILVHPGARTRFRQWDPRKFAEVINCLSSSCRIFLVGGPGEKVILQKIMKGLERPPDILATDLGLLEFSALCKLSNVFVGNDSAPIHIAAAAGVFVIGVYGPTFSNYCGPWTDRRALLDVSTLACRPCRQEVCKTSPEKACMADITSAMVIDKVREVLTSLQ